MMKKSKLSLCLVTSFIGALALSSCNEAATSGPTASTKSIVEGIEYNTASGKFEIDIDKFYEEYGEKEGTTLFYDSIVESLVRYKYKSLSEAVGSTLRPYTALVKEANDKIVVQHQLARDNASSNGTTEGEEWDNILESYSCKDENDLKEHFLYELEKTAIDDWFLKSNMTDLKDQYIGIKNDWSTLPQAADKDYSSVYPYHILHILVKLDADASDYSRATMTSAQAEKLWNVVQKLLDGQYDFERIVKDESEDTSADSYGDVGIMSTQTSFYNEFKLGIYAFDGILSGINSNTAETRELYEAFGIGTDGKYSVNMATVKDGGQVHEDYDLVTNLIQSEMIDEVQTAITGYEKDEEFVKYTNIPTVPYEVFKLIGESANLEKIGETDVKTAAAGYPRNVLFNQFLNFRSPFLITDEDISSVKVGGADVAVSSIDNTTAVGYKAGTSIHNFTKPGELEPQRLWYDKTNFFEPADDFVPSLKGSGKKVLATNERDVIIGVRSTAGIHFMVMRKSVFKNTNATSYEAYNAEDPSYNVLKSTTTLQDYYTTEVPTKDGTNYPTQSYVNIVKTSDPSYYTNRAETIKSKLKNADSSDIYDAAYNYRLFNYLIGIVGEANIKLFDGSSLNDSKTYQKIKDEILRLRQAKYYSNSESILSSWEEYMQQLRNQNKMRSLRGQLPTVCAFKFIKANDKNLTTAQRAAYLADFNEGGMCYAK